MKINNDMIKTEGSFRFNPMHKNKPLNISKDLMVSVRYSKDPLLKSKDMILNKDILNLYSALVRIEDFEKDRPLNSIPYLAGRIFDEIKPLISEEVIKSLEVYMQKKIPKKIVKFWLDNKVIPFPLVRVVSLLDKNPPLCLSKYIEIIDTITTNQKNQNLKLPLFFDELLSDKIIYFYGYLLGDGCISQERLIKLCDGHPNPDKVKYSFVFLKSIQNYTKETFNIYSSLIKIGNKYELIFTSRFLCRFFKFFYQYRKDKGFITKPEIIENNKEKSYIFYRGLFDADAGIKVKDKFFVFKSADKEFTEQCKKDFNEYGIITSEILKDKLNICSLKIYSQNLYSFARVIGFNHPRKKEILIQHLKKGCLIKKLVGINPTGVIGNKYYDLSKIQDLRVKGVSDIFKKNREKIGTQKKVAKLLNTYRENIKRWENNVNSIPFVYYIQLLNMNGISKIDILNDISKKEILLGKGKIKQYIRLPIIFKSSHLGLFKYLIPLINKVTVKSYGIDDRKLDKTHLFIEINNLFGIKVYKDSHSYVLLSNLVVSFLKTFYKYENSWDCVKDNEIKELCKKWKTIQE